MKKSKKLLLILPRKIDFLGVFCIAFATLMYELLLTRIFSVVIWYHFAFVAISAALFGMTVGAIGVYWFKDKIVKRGESKVLAEWSLYFGLLVLPALALLMYTPVGPITILVIALPFIASGVVLALALTYFSANIGPIYAADLLGAATGCFGVIAALKYTDGPTSVVIAAIIGMVGGMCFIRTSGRLKRATLGSLLVLVALVVTLCTVMSTGSHSMHILRLRYGKRGVEKKAIYEEWNSFSRVDVHTYPTKIPYGWGFSDNCDDSRDVDQLSLKIDGDAETILTKYDGVPDHYKYLKCDVVNIAHNLVPGANVAVVGAGGGRDVLSSLVFGDKSIKAIELNDEILAADNKKFGEYTGHLDRIPGVSFVNDEARSYLTRNPAKYDMIQISLIDTWAATAAGGYAVSENSIYTTQAWNLFIQRLSDRGILSVSRWYGGTIPFETYRTISLAAESLRESGISNPEQHIAVVTSRSYPAVSTLMVSKSPLDDVEIAKLKSVTSQYNFTLLAAPGFKSPDPVIAYLTHGEYAKAAAIVQGNISPPTDNQPFFFNFIRFKDLVTVSSWKYHSLASLGLLMAMAVVVVVLLGMVFAVPFKFARALITRANASLAVYFIGIGFGFMGIEIGFLQRLSIFFGHPAYSLVVVLPTILAASGIGSIMSGRRPFRDMTLRMNMLLLVVVLALSVLLVPWFVTHAVTLGTTARVLAVMAFLLPSGFLMGMPFAKGMNWAGQSEDTLKPWLWGLNGAASVAGSVLAVLLSITAGITYAFLLGIFGYVVTMCVAGAAKQRKM